MKQCPPQVFTHFDEEEKLEAFRIELHNFSEFLVIATTAIFMPTRKL